MTLAAPDAVLAGNEHQQAGLAADVWPSLPPDLAARTLALSPATSLVDLAPWGARPADDDDEADEFAGGQEARVVRAVVVRIAYVSMHAHNVN